MPHDPELAAEIGEENAREYLLLRRLPDGRIVGVHRLLYHWTLHIGLSAWGYEDRYCYYPLHSVLDDCLNWNGVGDPPGPWHRHPMSDRHRDPETGDVWSSNVPRPRKQA